MSARRDCVLCGGRGTVSIRRGHRVEWLIHCFRCTAPFEVLAQAYHLPLPERRDHHHVPVRAQSEFEQAVMDLLLRLDRRQAVIRRWIDYLDLSAEMRWEENQVRDLRRLATTLGDCAFAWDLLGEAAQRERRAWVILLQLENDLADRNPSRRRLCLDDSAALQTSA